MSIANKTMNQLPHHAATSSTLNVEEWRTLKMNIRSKFVNKSRPLNFNQGFMKISDSFKKSNQERRKEANIDGLRLTGTKMSAENLEVIKQKMMSNSHRITNSNVKSNENSQH